MESLPQFSGTRARAVYQKYPQTRWRILVSGTSGLIGKALVSFLEEGGHHVVKLVRTKNRGKNTLYWDPQAADLSPQEFEGFDAVIHLAGQNIADGFWTQKRKNTLFLSRCRDSWLLSQVFMRCQQVPSVFIGVSAVGIYGDRPKERLTEESHPGKGFLPELCEQWEKATSALQQRGVRVVHPRLGIVLSMHGGMLARLLPFFRKGLGAILGNGEQLLSWITLEDLLYSFYHILHTESLQGAVNVCAPFPVSQAEFSQTLAACLQKPLFLRLPKKMVQWVFGEMGEAMLLASGGAFPQKLLRTGFVFSHPTLANALSTLIQKT